MHLHHTSLLPHSDIFLPHRPFQTRSRGCTQPKTFRKGSEASSRAERWRGYVILFSNEPSCCYVATSERRRIRLKADYHCFALRGASIRRSQRSNSEAVLFRGTLPRRCSIRRSRCGNSSVTSRTFFTTFAASPIPFTLSCAATAKRVSNVRNNTIPRCALYYSNLTSAFFSIIQTKT